MMKCAIQSGVLQEEPFVYTEGDTDLQLMRVGTNAIYRVDEFDAVLRVHYGSAREVAQNLSLVEELSTDAPLLRPLQPKVAMADDFCATI